MKKLLPALFIIFFSVVEAGVNTSQISLPSIYFRKNSVKIDSKNFYAFSLSDTSKVIDSPEKYFKFFKGLLDENPGIKIEIIGHKDFNESLDSLSFKRAEIIKLKLIKLGIPSLKLKCVTHGSDHPIIRQKRILNEKKRRERKELKKQNQRVEFEIFLG